jgi:hypothetical protein
VTDHDNQLHLRHRGLTLLELVFVLLVVVVAAAVGAATYRGTVIRAQDRTAQVLLADIGVEAAELSRFDDAGFTSDVVADAALGARVPAARSGLSAQPSPFTVSDDPADHSDRFGKVHFVIAGDGDGVLGMAMRSQSGNCVGATVRLTGFAETWSWDRDLGTDCKAADAVWSGGHAPDAPQVTATPGSHQVTVTWSAPPAGVEPPVRFTVTRTSGATSTVIYTGPDLSFVDTGLDPSVTYTFTVVAVYDDGLHGPGGVDAARPWPLPPTLTLDCSTGTCTTGDYATLGATFYRVAWVGAAPGGPVEVTATTHSFAARGGQNSVSVRACNPSGCSDPGTTTAHWLAVPVLAATPNSGDPAGSIVVTWPAVDAATRYEIRRAGSAAGPFSAVTGADHTATSHTDTGLAAGTTYWYQGRACNPDVCSAWSSPVSQSTVPAGTTLVLTYPWNHDLAVSGSNNPTRFDLTWPAVTGAVRYELQRSTTSATVGFVTIVDANVTSHTDTGLTPNTRYWYRVRACNTAGCGAFSPAVDALTAPGTPGFTLTYPWNPHQPVSDTNHPTRLVATWAAPAGGVTITVQRRPPSGWTVIASGLTGTSHADGGLAHNTTYEYRVRACNTGPAPTNCSPYGDAQSRTIVPPAPTVHLNCPQGRHWWAANPSANPNDCVLSMTAGGATRFEGGTFSLNYSRTFNVPGSGSATFTSDNIPVGSLMVGVRACSAAGCSATTSVTGQAFPRPGLPSVIVTGCAHGFCNVNISAPHAQTYEVQLLGGPSGNLTCVNPGGAWGFACEGDGGPWTAAWHSFWGHVTTKHSTGGGARSFHYIWGCPLDAPGCTRTLIIPQGTWIRVSGTNGHLGYWPDVDGWCKPRYDAANFRVAPPDDTIAGNCRWSEPWVLL